MRGGCGGGGDNNYDGDDNGGADDNSDGGDIDGSGGGLMTWCGPLVLGDFCCCESANYKLEGE